MTEERETPWVLDDAARARSSLQLAAIDVAHANAPRCGLCGQRCPELDRFGLCSKTSVTHMEDRAAARAEMKARVRA